MNMNYLKYKMREFGYTNNTFAPVIGISVTSFQKRMNGQVEWNCKEMRTIKDMLKLDTEEFNKIFGF